MMSTDKSHLKSTHHTIARSAGMIGIATLVSRILGFIRDVVIARLFGVYVYAQAFVIAFRIPNLLRDFIAEGAMTAVIVPVYSEYKLKHTDKEFWELVNVVLNLLIVILMGITLLGIVIAPLLVRCMAPGFAADSHKLAVTISLTRVMFPFILLISLASYAMAILNTLKTFVVSAFAPCLLNIAMIVCAFLFGEGVAGLAVGVLIGGLLQLAVQIPALYRKGYRFALPPRKDRPEIRTIGRLMTPRFFSTSIYQLNNFVDSIFGSFVSIVGEGGVAVLYFSYRLVQFPFGVFSNALAQALLPTFSTQALQEDKEHLKATLSWALRLSFLVILPSSAVFITLAHPIITTLFGGGRFDAYASGITATTLMYYSFGIFAYSTSRILQTCFFALKDTVSPTKVAGIALALNVVLDAILMFPFKIGGIAVATSISGIVSCILLFSMLRRKIGAFGGRGILKSFVRISAASACMGVICYFLWQASFLAGVPDWLKLSVTLGVGAVGYAGMCMILKVEEIRWMWLWISQKKIADG